MSNKDRRHRTPSPWGTAYSAERDNFMVIGPDGDSRIGQAMEREDARLMAAAPDLLDALRGLLEFFDREFPNGWNAPIARHAHEAISKATEE